jgi:hypothetical protein
MSDVTTVEETPKGGDRRYDKGCFKVSRQYQKYHADCMQRIFDFLPTVISITPHVFIQEVSGIAVNDVALRIIPTIPVMIVSEKIPARASFLCSFI